MYVSQTVMEFLDRHDADFEVLTHPRSRCADESARRAGIPRNALAKAVLMEANGDLLLALVPASKRVDPMAIAALLHAGPPALAEEEDLPFVFRDCELGAIPAVGPAFGLPTVVDDALLRRADTYFEAGDHEHLVHMHGGSFARMLLGQPHGQISC